MSLNPNQLRAVSIRLRLLEERLATVRNLMDTEERGVLYHRNRPQFSVDQRGAMVSLLAEAHAEIALLAEAFHLPCEEQDSARKIVGLLAITWQNLGDIRAQGLAGHGDVDPGLHDTLDPSVERLMELILALEKAASRTR